MLASGLVRLELTSTGISMRRNELEMPGEEDGVRMHRRRIGIAVAISALMFWSSVSASAQSGAETAGSGAATVEDGMYKYDCNPDKADIVGTPGDDVLRGTGAEVETICGLGGNDTIYTGVNEHASPNITVYGGPGDDRLISEEGAGATLVGDEGDDSLEGSSSAERMHGEEGNDVLKGNDTSIDSGLDTMRGGPGDDVMLGGTKSVGEIMYGNSGNDVLAPTTVTGRVGNRVNGGDGNDVAVTLNFKDQFTADTVDLDGTPQIYVGSTCRTAVYLDYSADGYSEGEVSCSIPWPKVLSGLEPILPITATLDGEKNLTISSNIGVELASSLSDDELRALAEYQAGLSGDSCICDPLIGIGQIPDNPYPADWAA